MVFKDILEQQQSMHVLHIGWSYSKVQDNFKRIHSTYPETTHTLYFFPVVHSGRVNHPLLPPHLEMVAHVMDATSVTRFLTFPMLS